MTMTNHANTPPECEHHWVHYGQPSHSPIRWIVKCSQCNQFNIPDLQEQVDEVIAAAEQRGAIKALRDAAQVLREDVDIVFNKHRGIFFREDEADRKGISPWGWLENRADQIADQEDNDEQV